MSAQPASGPDIRVKFLQAGDAPQEDAPMVELLKWLLEQARETEREEQCPAA